MAGSKMWFVRNKRVVALQPKVKVLKRRRYRRGRGSVTRNPASASIVPGFSPFPERFKCKHVYNGLNTLTQGTAGTFGTEQVWNLNDLFDPDYTAAGHQPYGRDTMATLYNKYKVRGIKVEVTFTNPSADGCTAAILFNPPGSSATLAGSTGIVMGEKPNVLQVQLNNSGAQVTKFSRYFPMHKLLQVSKLQFDADTSQYEAATGSQPSQIPRMAIAICDNQGGSSTTVSCFTRLTYDTTWDSRIQLTQS